MSRRGERKRYDSRKPYALDSAADSSELSYLAAHHDTYFADDHDDSVALVSRVLGELVAGLPEIQRVALEQIVMRNRTHREAASHYAAGLLMESPLSRVRVAARRGVPVAEVTFDFLVRLGDYSQRRIDKPVDVTQLADYTVALTEARELRGLLELASHRRLHRASLAALATVRAQLLGMGWLRPYLADLLEGTQLDSPSAPHGAVAGGLLASLLGFGAVA